MYRNQQLKDSKARKSSMLAAEWQHKTETRICHTYLNMFSCLAVSIQELQNSVLDRNRQLDEAKARESTMLAVERQHKADIVSMTNQMNAAEQRAADCEAKLAYMATDLKVGYHSAHQRGCYLNTSCKVDWCRTDCKARLACMAADFKVQYHSGGQRDCC